MNIKKILEEAGTYFCQVCGQIYSTESKYAFIECFVPCHEGSLQCVSLSSFLGIGFPSDINFLHSRGDFRKIIKKKVVPR